MDYSQTFCFAGFNILFICDDARLIESINQRYKQFQTLGAADIQVSLSWKRQANIPAYTDPLISFNHDRLAASCDVMEGLWNINQPLVHVRLLGSRSVEAVDYFLRAVMAVLIFKKGGLMVHGAGILHQGKGFLFFGKSGSGKTTVSRSSLNDTVLNDDLVVLMPQKNKWQLLSTPFWNPTQVEPKPIQTSLHAIYRLIQDKTVFVESLNPSRALAELFANIPIVPIVPSLCEELMERCISLLHDVPAYGLHFLPDGSFWQVIANASYDG
jgi:hypothetical protein